MLVNRSIYINQPLLRLLIWLGIIPGKKDCSNNDVTTTKSATQDEKEKKQS